VRDLLSHAVPSGKTEDVLLHVLREARRLHERRRYGAKGRTAKVSPETLPGAGGRHVPATVRREVYDRDGGAYTYVGPEGRRCGSTWQIELQHIEPAARGGESTAANTTLFCRAHNQLQAEKDFGPAYVAARRNERVRKEPPPPPPPPHAQAADVISVLTNMGYKKKEAEPAVATAATQVLPGDDLMTLLRAAFRVLRGPMAPPPR
jgi:5-methylcytosine-specific restriction endonuclease McrA